jgi:hypothetical protein
LGVWAKGDPSRRLLLHESRRLARPSEIVRRIPCRDDRFVPQRDNSINAIRAFRTTPAIDASGPVARPLCFCDV